MAGESITRLIFFIGAVMIAVGVVGVIKTSANSITVSYGMSSSTQADQIKTQITIINDPINIPYALWWGGFGVGWVQGYSFYVKNTGNYALDPNSINMFIDGNYTNTTGYWTVMNGGSIWYPTYVLNLNYTTSTKLSSGDHTVRVVAGNGAFDEMPFIIP